MPKFSRRDWWPHDVNVHVTHVDELNILWMLCCRRWVWSHLHSPTLTCHPRSLTWIQPLCHRRSHDNHKRREPFSHLHWHPHPCIPTFIKGLFSNLSIAPKYPQDVVRVKFVLPHLWLSSHLRVSVHISTSSFCQNFWHQFHRYNPFRFPSSYQIDKLTKSG